MSSGYQVTGTSDGRGKPLDFPSDQADALAAELRAASAMGANEHALFWKVIIPGASPFIIAGLRQSFLRAWIAVIGAEMLAGSDWGLGCVIFDAKEFLDADVMLASLIVIGFIGFATERLVFGSVERATIYRWGMARSARA